MTKTKLAPSIAAAALGLAACGGGSPLDNPPLVANPEGSTGQKLSFEYFQRCVMPVLEAPLRVTIGGQTSINTCAAAGCHDNKSGTGGALRITAGVPRVDLSVPGNGPDAVRQTEMYKNFYSSQGEAVVGQPAASRLLLKPLVRGVLHGGGLIFETDDDPNARLLRYWISRPMPQGQDEFGSASTGLFDPATGACKTE